MQLNAINSVGFKGNCQHNKQESCPECEFNFEDKKAIAAFDKFQNVVASEDIKGPGAIVASIGCAAGKTFAKGAGTALILDKFTKDGAISKGFEGVLKKGSKIAKNVAEKITTADATGFKKLGNIAAKGINKTEDIARNAYKKISNGQAPRGMAIVVGAVAAVVGLCEILKRDNNEDGVKDIIQKSQSVYDKSAKNLDKLSETAGIAAELAQILA